jgi:tetratricopeptide (TPR) repeat protein
MDARAAELLAAARTARDGGDRAAARDAYVEALRYDPSPEVAAELKAMLSPPTHRELALTQSDTLRRIAEREYGNPGGEILLAKVNNKSVVDILDPGEMVKLPILSEALAQRIEISLAPVEQVAPVAPAEPAQEEMMTEPEAEAVEVVIQETPADRITPLLSMARLQFSNGLYETVVSITNEILQLDPGNEQALEIQRESYYSLAEGFISDGSNVRAMRMLRNLPRDYRATKELTGKVQQALDTTSEPLYLQGVNYYINEELERAVDSWELTLQANPWHKKARTDLEKARKLLEAVRGL